MSNVVEVSADLKVVEIIGGGTITIDGGGGGATNLDYTASTTNGIVTSSTGTDATIPLVSTNAGLMSPSDKTKLDGVATGATANSSDATLLNRANHTGNQAISTVTGLQTALDGKQATGDYATNTALTNGLATKENTITAGTTAQYYRGDKTFQTLDKTAVGLDNVDNTSDANKPVSTATQTALNAKQNTITTGTISQYFRGDLSLATLDKTAVGLGNVANVDTTTTANITDVSNKRFITDAQQTVLGNTSGTNTGDNAVNSLYSGLATSKENTITAGTTAQYWRGDKTFQTLDKTAVGLANVDNTSDANKPVSTAQQTAINARIPYTGASSAIDLNRQDISNFDGSVNVQTGTSYTLLSADSGRIITLNNASAITLTVPSGLGVGFNCTVIQKGAGVVTFTASGTTIVNRQSHTKTAGQHAVCGLFSDVDNNFYLTGDTAT